MWQDRELDQKGGELQVLVYSICVGQFGGGYSPEHGVGPHNRGHYERYGSPAKQAVCTVPKDYFDPSRQLPAQQ